MAIGLIRNYLIGGFESDRDLNFSLDKSFGHICLVCTGMTYDCSLPMNETQSEVGSIKWSTSI